jgi:hypothetical protein
VARAWLVEPNQNDGKYKRKPIPCRRRPKIRARADTGDASSEKASRAVVVKRSRRRWPRVTSLGMLLAITLLR